MKKYKKIKNFKAFWIILYIGSFFGLFIIYKISAKVDFIPIINNLILIISSFSFLAYHIFFIKKITDLGINFYIKLILSLILIAVLILSTYIFVIFSIFLLKDGGKFSYEGKNYYIINEGWLNEDYVVYKKNILMMDKMTLAESIGTFKDLNKISDNSVKEDLDIYLNIKEETIENSPKEKRVNENPNDPDDKASILNKFSLNDVIKIPNSDYGLLEVDRAGPRSRWSFVKIENDRLFFISELEDTSPSIKGKIDHYSNIILECKDIHENIIYYRSNDGGNTFEIVE